MKKKYFKWQQFSALFLVCLQVVCFNSCNKSDKLGWTTWESDYFEVEYKDPTLPSHPYLDEELILRGQLTVSFEENYATITTHSLELFDRNNNIIYHSANPTMFLRANYTCEGNKVTLTFDSGTGFFFSGKTCTGKVNKTTMKLKIAFGETVKFRKIN